MSRTPIPLSEEVIARVEQLHAAGYRPTNIAEQLGLHRRQVNRILEDHMKIKPVVVIRRRKLPLPPEETVTPYDPVEVQKTHLEALLDDRRPNPIDVARTVWEGRLRIDDDRMTLDGWEVGLTTLMRRTNRELRGKGLRQLDVNPAWRV